MTWVHRAQQAGTCSSPASSEPADLLAELAQVPALQAGLPACRACTSPASRSACSPSWYQPSKQPSKQVYLLAELIPAQQAGLPARLAGTSPASRSTCSPNWYQLSKQVYMLAQLVPAQQAGARSASSLTCLLSWYLPREQVDLLAGLAQVPARRAG
ncbi:hypothetical protein PCANC_11304 [Puccinia coronata f. sp. avenae]|uniref:Uncharacterized protein n=1 Tax=Puccinia coronata f. sp. avenae TaxID=200324 RepID=A0A2N5V5A8_9BASI|nr:hypothetical protein PCANC_11304 [Puccinia coronata f. sp. avenae]